MIWFQNTRYIPEVRDSVRLPSPFGGLHEQVSDTIGKHRTRREIEAQGGWDSALYNQARAGKLNKNEFVALQMYQAETERLRSKFLQDGVLDENERRILQERQDNSWRLYRKYVDGDYYPEYDIGGKDQQGNYRNYSYDRKIHDQYEKLYFGIRDGSITQREYLHADSNLEAIQRYRGVAGEFRNWFDPYSRYQHQILRSALDYNNSLIDGYYNNWERTWPRIFF